MTWLLALVACPVCAQQAAPGTSTLLLSFLAAPFAVAALVVYAIRHADS